MVTYYRRQIKGGGPKDLILLVGLVKKKKKNISELRDISHLYLMVPFPAMFFLQLFRWLMVLPTLKLFKNMTSHLLFITPFKIVAHTALLPAQLS